MNHLSDFPDRLSPMLVKELRQGMRARGFTLLFLIFQCLLALILLMSGSAAGAATAGTAVSGVIFTMFSIAVLIVQPMRGMSALSSEISGNTIEMMALTRLSASRIVLGKWVAIVSQSALILTTIIPYLVLRYFYGGMVLVSEMATLALIFLTSMALTAVTVGLSAFASKLMRSLFIIAVVLGLYMMPMMIFSGRSSMFTSSITFSDRESFIAVGAYIAFIAYAGWCAISQGTAAIAPAAENHSTIRRTIAFVLAAGFAAATRIFEMPVEVALTVFAIIITPAVLTSLTEPFQLMSPLCKPFVKLGAAGKAAGLLLLPGWPAGVFFSLLLIVISVAGLMSPKFSSSLGIDEIVVCGAVIGGVLLPALFAANFTKIESKRFGVFIVALLACGAIALLANLFCFTNNHEQFLWLFVWDPLVFLGMVDHFGFNKQSLLNVCAIVDGIIALLLFLTACRKAGEYRRIMGDAEIELANAAANPVPAT